MSVEAIDEPPPVPDSLAKRIELLLPSYLNREKMGLDGIADGLGVSRRTLQRRLAEDGTSLTEVVDEWRFTTAVRLLGEEFSSLADISAALGYANVPNFERAFRRWTGTTPGRYRDSIH